MKEKFLLVWNSLIDEIGLVNVLVVGGLILFAVVGDPGIAIIVGLLYAAYKFGLLDKAVSYVKARFKKD